MDRLRRQVMWGIVGAMLTAGCGGGAEDPASRGGGDSPSSASPDLITADVLATCAGFGPEQAAGFLGVPASGVVDRSESGSGSFRICSFASAEDTMKSVSFSLRLDDSVEKAATGFEQLLDNLPVAAGAQRAAGVESGESAVIEVSGLGDEAVWTSVNDSLTVRQANLTILVMSPWDRPAQIAVAEQVLERLR